MNPMCGVMAAVPPRTSRIIGTDLYYLTANFEILWGVSVIATRRLSSSGIVGPLPSS